MDIRFAFIFAIVLSCTMSKRPSVDAFNKVLPSIPVAKEYIKFSEYSHNLFRQELNIILSTFEIFFFDLLGRKQLDDNDSILFYTKHNSDRQIIDLINTLLKSNPELEAAGKLEHESGLFLGGFVNYLAHAELKELLNLTCSVSKKMRLYSNQDLNHTLNHLEKFNREELLSVLYSRRTFVYFPNIVLKDEVYSILSDFSC